MRFATPSLRTLLCIASSNQTFAQAGPLRIGFLTVRTGPLTPAGGRWRKGSTLPKERNSTLSGRKVEIIFADTAGQPAQAKTKAQELVEREKVHILVGPLATFEALAVDDYVLQAEGAAPPPMSAARRLTSRSEEKRLRHPYLRHRGAGDGT
jgi:branched-chain amino acid transport system substrate-binding protein